MATFLSYLSRPGREEQVTIRGRTVLVPRLRRIELRHREPRAPAIRADATYLVTGGMGALGLQVARWLAASGARHLALLGRKRPLAAAEKELRCLVEQGVTVRTLQADISQYAEVEHALAELATTLPPLRGVLHAAGVVDDGTLPGQTYARFSRVLAPKVRGAWNLHRLTRDDELDFFVVFSSMAALWGPPGRASYAAANAFLDQFAAYRRSLGLPGLSINYGSWGGGGMATSNPEYEREQRLVQGQEFLTPREGIQALAWALGRDGVQPGVCRVDWAVFGRQFPRDAMPMIFSDLTLAGLARPSREPAALATRPSNTNSEIVTSIRREVATLLGGEAHELDDEQPLTELGMDSFTVLVLRGRLANEFKAAGNLPVGWFFGSATIASLCAEIAALDQDSWTDEPSLASSAAPLPPPPVPAGGALEVVRAGRGGTTVVLVGQSEPLHGLVMGLPEEVPVWWLKLEGIHEATFRGRSVVETSAGYFAELQGTLAPGPMILIGISYSGLLTFDLTCLLQLTGRPVRALLLEPSLPGGLRPSTPAPFAGETLPHRVFRHLHGAWAQGWGRYLWPRLSRRAFAWLGHCHYRLWTMTGGLLPSIGPRWFWWWLRYPHIVRNVQRYVPWTRARDVFLAGRPEWLEENVAAWRQLIDGDVGRFISEASRSHEDVGLLPAAIEGWLGLIRHWIADLSGARREEQ